MRSIEVLGCMVASEPLRNNPYLGQPHTYGDPVARPHQAAPEHPPPLRNTHDDRDAMRHLCPTIRSLPSTAEIMALAMSTRFELAEGQEVSLGAPPS